MRVFLAAAAAVLGLARAADTRFPEQEKDSKPIRDQQYRQMDRYFTGLIEQAERKRAEYWKKLDFSSPGAYDRSVQQYRDDWVRYLGVPQTSGVPLEPRRQKLAEFEDSTAYRVWLQTLPGVEAYGILL